MRYLLAAVLVVGVAAPVVAEEGFDHSEYRAFRRAVDGVPGGGTRLAFRLWRCNVAASRKLGRRSPLETVGRSIESEAQEAMASCAAELDVLARDAPASQVAAIKAAIVLANVETIKLSRNPPTVACAGEIPAAMCWRPWRR